MIRFDRVRAGSIRDLSFQLGKGASAKILFESQDRKNELFRVLAGLHRPQSGVISVFGDELYTQQEKTRLSCFQHIGVVPEEGGLISNLKAWENLVLPVWYHRHLGLPEAEQEILKIFSRLDEDEKSLHGWLGSLPDRLALHQKRMVALGRAMLMQPKIMIYDFTFTRLEREAAQRLMRLTQEFHADNADRISLYLCPDDALSAHLMTDHSIDLTTH